MRVPLLLLLACTAVLAAQTRADEPGEQEELVRKVQEYTQKASVMARSALSRVQESEVVPGRRIFGALVQARQWLLDNAELAKQKLVQLKEQVVQLWKSRSAV